MILKTYREKRNFSRTPEPQPNRLGNSKVPIFVVQKHKATTLHFDFRLEIGGVLKSWAVPKEPTLNSKIKRLAIMTEDHPLEYQNFEGIIPEGNYGAGSVEIWDKGNFLPFSGSINDLELGLKTGHLSIILNGRKLKGEFALTRFKNAKTKNAWLLIKAEDEYSKIDR